jgi:hypothetical protein
MSGDGAYEWPKHVALLINAVRIVMLDCSIYGNIDTECVYCAVRAEPLNKYNTYGISCNSAKINFRISTGTQHSPSHVINISSNYKIYKYKIQSNCAAPLTLLHIPNFAPPVTLHPPPLPSFLNHLPCRQSIFLRRTNGHSIENWRAENCLFLPEIDLVAPATVPDSFSYWYS